MINLNIYIYIYISITILPSDAWTRAHLGRPGWLDLGPQIDPSRFDSRSTSLFDRPSRPKSARRGLFDRLFRPKWLEKGSERRFWTLLGRFWVPQRVDFRDFSVAFRSSGPTRSKQRRHSKNLQKP